MTRSRYPLSALAGLRDKKVDDAASTLAAAARERQTASQTLQTAQLRRKAHALSAAQVRTAELEALSRGELRARDLARVDAWGVRVAGEQRALAAAVEGARIAEADAGAREGQAKAALVAHRADARVVAEHRARWEIKKRKVLEVSEEEASAEAWRPKR